MHTKWLPLSYIHCFVPSKQVWGTFYLMGPWSITPSSSALLLVCSSGKLIKPKSMCLQPRALSLPNLRCHRSFYGLDGCTLRSHMLDSYSPPSQYRKCDNCRVGVGMGLLVHEGRDSAAKLVSLETGSLVPCTVRDHCKESPVNRRQNHPVVSAGTLRGFFRPPEL